MPATNLHGGISGSLTSSVGKPNTFIRYGFGSTNRCRIVNVLPSFREDDGNARDNTVRAIELKKFLEESPPLPKPLSSNKLAESVSNGSSRVRVAYQGVRGAYSESAAEKAYPNCEAVPCEEFDTAFEARISFLRSYFGAFAKCSVFESS